MPELTGEKNNYGTREDNHIRIFPLQDIPIIKKGDDVVGPILEAVERPPIYGFRDRDILLVCHTFIGKAIGYTVSLSDIKPDRVAKIMARGDGVYPPPAGDYSPELMKLVLDKSRSIIRARPYVIGESESGIISALSGIDKSNIEGGENYTYLPPDGDEIAEDLRKEILRRTGKKIGVIITDSQGRPFRIGSVGVAVGLSGISPMVDYRGYKDLFGYKLKEKRVNIADGLAAAAVLVMGEGDEGIPAVVIRGYGNKITDVFKPSEGNRSLGDILRPPPTDMFRKPDVYMTLMGFTNYKGTFSNKEIPESIINEAISFVRYIPYVGGEINIIRPSRPYNKEIMEILSKHTPENPIKNGDPPLILIIGIPARAIFGRDIGDDIGDRCFTEELNRNNSENISDIVFTSITAGIYIAIMLKYHGLSVCILPVHRNTAERYRLIRNTVPTCIIYAGYSEKKDPHTDLFPERRFHNFFGYYRI